MPNLATYLGPAISSGGENLSQFGDKRDALAEQFQLMLQRRAQAALQAQQAADENRRADAANTRSEADQKIQQADADRKSTDDKNQQDFLIDLQKGNQTPASAPVQENSSYPGQTPQDSNPVISSASPTSIPFTRKQLVQKALERGVLSPEKYLEYSKEDPNETILPLALNELSTIVKNNPADTKKGLQARNAATTALRAKYPMLNGQEGFEKSIGDALKSETSPVINIGMGVRTKSAIENNIRGINATQVKPYQLIRNAAINFMNDYNDYKNEGQKAGNNRQATLGMIDKFITASTGKATGQAQFLESTGWQGYVTELNKLRDQAANGDLTGPEAVEQMKRITLSNAESMRKQARLANANSDEMVAAENSNPENIAAGIQLTPAATHTIGEAAHAADSTLYANAKPKSIVDTTGASKIKTKSGKSYLLRLTNDNLYDN